MARQAQVAARTRVEFFTMVRGVDPEAPAAQGRRLRTGGQIRAAARDGRRCNVGCRAVWRRLWGDGLASHGCGGGWLEQSLELEMDMHAH